MSNEDKLSLIYSRLPFIKKRDLNLENVKEVNEALGIAKNPSTQTVQSPGRWSVDKLSAIYIDQKHEFEECCKFKWSFNIKPDLVIQLPNKMAICIETKFESGEAAYPLDGKDKKNIQRKKYQPY